MRNTTPAHYQKYFWQRQCRRHHHHVIISSCSPTSSSSPTPHHHHHLRKNYGISNNINMFDIYRILHHERISYYSTESERRRRYLDDMEDRDSFPTPAGASVTPIISNNRDSNIINHSYDPALLSSQQMDITIKWHQYQRKCLLVLLLKLEKIRSQEAEGSHAWDLPSGYGDEGDMGGGDAAAAAASTDTTATHSPVSATTTTRRKKARFLRNVTREFLRENFASGHDASASEESTTMTTTAEQEPEHLSHNTIFPTAPPRKLQWTHFQRLKLQHLLDLESTRMVTYYVTIINAVLMSHHLHRNPIGENQRDMILRWLRDNHFTYPPFREFEHLRLHTGLTDVQLRFHLKRAIRQHKHRPLPQHVKHLLERYMEQREYKFPSLRERRQLLQELKSIRQQEGIFSSQIHDYLRHLKEYHPKVTPEAVNLVKEWIKLHPRDAKPSASQRKHLLSQTGISSSQLSNLLVAHAKKGSADEESKNYLKDWLEKNQRRPTTEERRQLREHLQWNEAQLNRYVTRFFNSQNAGKITKTTRKKLTEWLEQNVASGESPTLEQKHTLQELLGISRAQLDRLLQRLHTPSQSIQVSNLVSEETKAFIKSWLEKNNYQLPTAEQKEELIQRTQLSRSILGRLIRNERSKVPVYILERSTTKSKES